VVAATAEERGMKNAPILLALLLVACPPPGATGDTDGGDSLPPDNDDRDGDGVGVADGDCDDEDPQVYPGAPEIPYDGADQDCDGSDSLDADGDGYDAAWFGGDDCDDGDDGIHPGASEICGDGVDQDCSGDPDDGETDADGDSYVSWSCTGGDDCDDGDAEIRPGRALRVPDDFPTVAQAVAAVCSSSVITVAAGTYRGTIDASGKAISLIGEAGAAQTVLEGDGTGSVLVLGDSSGEALLSGFTVTGGHAELGGGLHCTGSCTIEDSVFEGNSASYGGGVALVGASLSVASCHFEGNTADEGAGLFIESSSGSVSDTSFSSQIAARGGAGASVWYSEVDFTGVTAESLQAASARGRGQRLHLQRLPGGARRRDLEPRGQPRADGESLRGQPLGVGGRRLLLLGLGGHGHGQQHLLRQHPRGHQQRVEPSGPGWGGGWLRLRRLHRDPLRRCGLPGMLRLRVIPSLRHPEIHDS
jgi:hypothetical protein